MENPATWGDAERVINESYGVWLEDRAAGKIGWSLAMQIANALREAGLLKDSEKVEKVRDQINEWHNSHNGFGVSLNEYLGWGHEEMKTYVLRGEVPNE